MSNSVATARRAGQADAPHDDRRAHILVVFADDRHGALDRIVNVLRRRRANTRNLTFARSEVANVVRVTLMMDDSEVAVEQLVEQLRKIVDVRHVTILASEQTVVRELALIKINSGSGQQAEIIELGHLFGAHPVDFAAETITLEVTGSSDKLERLLEELQPFGVREVARTGSLAIIRGNGKEMNI
jgi:acetolactate synthase I/III small subunit